MLNLDEQTFERRDAWLEVAAWLRYAAREFATDELARRHLDNTAECVREEGERRYGAILLVSAT